jgi:hypothetical protein
MRRKDPLSDFIKKYGKTTLSLDDREVIGIMLNNPKNVVYVPLKKYSEFLGKISKKEFLKILKKDLEADVEETVGGSPGYWVYTEESSEKKE